jgi:hypothetical protein
LASASSELGSSGPAERHDLLGGRRSGGHCSTQLVRFAPHDVPVPAQESVAVQRGPMTTTISPSPPTQHEGAARMGCPTADFGPVSPGHGHHRYGLGGS